MDNKGVQGINKSQHNDDSEFSTTTDDGIPIKKLYVKNIPDNIKKNELTSIFEKYGEVKCNYPRGKKSKRYAFVTFTDENIALKVRISSHKKQLVCGGNILKVSPATSHKQPDYRAYKEYKHSMAKSKTKNKPVHDLLDDDCLIKIFQYLPILDRLRMERVSKRWRAVSLQSWSNIKNLCFGIEFHDMNDINRYVHWELMNNKSVEKILTLCGRFLHTLKIDAYIFLCTSDVIPTITKYCHNLNCLSLRLRQYSEESLASLFLSTPKLTKLQLYDLDLCFDGNCLEYLPLDSMEDINLLANRKFLEFEPSFGLRSGTRPTFPLTENAAMTFGKMSKLRSLELNRFQLQYNQLKYITDNEAITHLTFYQCSIEEPIFITNLHELTYLNLSYALEIDDEFFNNLTTKCIHIKYLDISGCTAVTDIGIHTIAKLCELQTLKINKLFAVTDDAIRILRTLKVLHCPSCPGVTNNGLIDLVENSVLLEELDISYSNVTPKLLTTVDNIITDQSNRVPLKIIVHSELILYWNDLNLTTSSLNVALCDYADENPAGLTFDSISYEDSDNFDSDYDIDHDYDDWENDVILI